MTADTMDKRSREVGSSPSAKRHRGDEAVSGSSGSHHHHHAPIALVNKMMPHFVTDACNYDKSFEEIDTQKVIGPKTIVLFFFKDIFEEDTMARLKQWQESWDSFQARSCLVYGVSTATKHVYKGFRNFGQTVEFPLLADQDHKITKAYGVFDEETGLANPGVFVIERKGKVVYEERYAPGIIEPNVDVLLDLLDTMEQTEKDY